MSAAILPFEDPKVIEFSPRCEHCGKVLSACTCDVWIACCGECGMPIYGGDSYELKAVGSKPVYSCPDCVEAEAGWHKTLVVLERWAA